MRLWHYKLISVLPQAMLISQWRECIAMKRQWDKGTLNRRLVSYIKDYDRSYFLNYVYKIVCELDRRNIKYQVKYYDEISNFCNNDLKYNDIFLEHNNRYLKQCYYNLEEKYDRKIISLEEFNKIKSLYNNVFR